jgi:hypothetical protein
MALQTLTFQIQGVAPLLLHNGQTTDPLNHFTKALKKITAKRSKTDADYEELMKLEWQAGLYIHEGKVVIPGDVLQAMLESAAKRIKKGPAAKSGVSCIGMFPLEYDDTADLQALFEKSDYRLMCKAKIGKNSIMRTRPKFNNWRITFTVDFDDTIFSANELQDILVIAGREVGLCDWRPRYGRFKVVP